MRRVCLCLFILIVCVTSSSPSGARTRHHHHHRHREKGSEVSSRHRHLMNVIYRLKHWSDPTTTPYEFDVNYFSNKQHDDDDFLHYQDQSSSELSNFSDRHRENRRRLGGHGHGQGATRVDSRPSDYTNISEIAMANKNVLRLAQEGLCRWPRPQLVKVGEVYPHPSKSYHPHCALLHKCSDRSGCCRSDTMSCVAVKIQKIYFYFYTVTYGPVRRTRVEKLHFYNDTECECRDQRVDEMPRDTPTVPTPVWRDEILRKLGIKTDETPQKPCPCTSRFSSRPSKEPGGECSCDCFDKERACIKEKRGHRHLSSVDRHCIDVGNCMVPTCSFGRYVPSRGRCPTKTDKVHQARGV